MTSRVNYLDFYNKQDKGDEPGVAYSTIGLNNQESARTQQRVKTTLLKKKPYDKILSPRSLYLKDQTSNIFPKTIKNFKRNGSKRSFDSYSCKKDEEIKEKLEQQKKTNYFNHDKEVTGDEYEKCFYETEPEQVENRIMRVKRNCASLMTQDKDQQQQQKNKNFISKTMLENCDQLTKVINSNPRLHHLNILEHTQNYVRSLGNVPSEHCNTCLTDNIHHPFLTYNILNHNHLARGENGNTNNTLEIKTLPSSVAFPAYQPMHFCYYHCCCDHNENKASWVPLECRTILYQVRRNNHCVECLHNLPRTNCCPSYRSVCSELKHQEQSEIINSLVVGSSQPSQSCLQCMKSRLIDKTNCSVPSVQLATTAFDKPIKLEYDEVASRGTDGSKSLDAPKASDVPKYPFLLLEDKNKVKKLLSSTSSIVVESPTKGKNNLFNKQIELKNQLISRKEQASNSGPKEENEDLVLDLSNRITGKPIMEDDYYNHKFPKKKDSFLKTMDYSNQAEEKSRITTVSQLTDEFCSNGSTRDTGLKEKQNTSPSYLREAVKKEFILRTLKDNKRKEFEQTTENSATKPNANRGELNSNSVITDNSFLYNMKPKTALSTTKNTHFEKEEEKQKARANVTSSISTKNNNLNEKNKRSISPNFQQASETTNNSKYEIKHQSTSANESSSRSLVSELVINMIQRVLQENPSNVLFSPKDSSSLSPATESKQSNILTKESHTAAPTSSCSLNKKLINQHIDLVSPSNDTSLDVLSDNKKHSVVRRSVAMTDDESLLLPHIQKKSDTKARFKILRRTHNASSTNSSKNNQNITTKLKTGHASWISTNVWFQESNTSASRDRKKPCNATGGSRKAVPLTPPSKINFDTNTIFPTRSESSKNTNSRDLKHKKESLSTISVTPSSKQQQQEQEQRHEQRQEKKEQQQQHAFSSCSVKANQESSIITSNHNNHTNKKINNYNYNWIIPLNSFELTRAVQQQFENNKETTKLWAGRNQQNKSGSGFNNNVSYMFRRAQFRGPQAVLYNVQHHHFMTANEKLFVLKKMMYHMTGPESVSNVNKPAFSSRFQLTAEEEPGQTVSGEEEEVLSSWNQSDHQGLASEIIKFGRTGYSNVRLPRTSISVKNMSKNTKCPTLEEMYSVAQVNNDESASTIDKDQHNSSQQEQEQEGLVAEFQDFEEAADLDNSRNINWYIKNSNGNNSTDNGSSRSIDKDNNSDCKVNSNSNHINNIYYNVNDCFFFKKERGEQMETCPDENDVSCSSVCTLKDKTFLANEECTTSCSQATKAVCFDISSLSDEKHSNKNTMAAATITAENMKECFNNKAVMNVSDSESVCEETVDDDERNIRTTRRICNLITNSIEVEVKETRSFSSMSSSLENKKKILPSTIVCLHELSLYTILQNKKSKQKEFRDFLRGIKNQNVLFFIRKKKKLILRSLEILYSLMVQLCDVEWELMTNYPPKQYLVLRRLGLNRDYYLSKLFFWTTGFDLNECFISQYLSDEIILGKGVTKAMLQLENIIKCVNFVTVSAETITNNDYSHTFQEEKYVSSVTSSIFVIYFFLQYTKGQRLLYRLLLVIPWCAAIVLAALILIALSVSLIRSEIEKEKSTMQNGVALEQLKRVTQITLFGMICSSSPSNSFDCSSTNNSVVTMNQKQHCQSATSEEKQAETAALDVLNIKPSEPDVRNSVNCDSEAPIAEAANNKVVDDEKKNIQNNDSTETTEGISSSIKSYYSFYSFFHSFLDFKSQRNIDATGFCKDYSENSSYVTSLLSKSENLNNAIDNNKEENQEDSSSNNLLLNDDASSTKTRCNMCLVFGVGDMIQREFCGQHCAINTKNKKSLLNNKCHHVPFPFLVIELVKSLKVLGLGIDSFE